MILAIAPRPDPTCAKSQKHRPDQFPKTGGVHRVLPTLAAMLEVMRVQGGSRQGDALSGLIIGNQPLDGCRADPGGVAQLVAWAQFASSQAWAVRGLLSSHCCDQRGARPVRRGLDQEGGARVGHQLGLGGAQAVGGAGGVEAGVEGGVEGGGGRRDRRVEGRRDVDCARCICWAGKLTRIHILQNPFEESHNCNE